MSVCLSLPSSIPTLRMKEEEEEEEEEADGDRISGSALSAACWEIGQWAAVPSSCCCQRSSRFFRAKLWTTSIIRGGREEGTRSRGQGTDRGKVPSSKLGQSTD